MRSCCFGCEHVDEDKACRRCRKCEKRLALLARLDYLAQDRHRDGEAWSVSRGITRYHGQPESWAG
jgi:hypothetical protein